MVDGRHFENRYIAIFSEKLSDFDEVLYTLRQTLNPVTVTSPKIEIFGVQDGGGRHLEIRFFGHTAKTDFLEQISNANLSYLICSNLFLYSRRENNSDVKIFVMINRMRMITL